jgi:hypothetical protein
MAGRRLRWMSAPSQQGSYFPSENECRPTYGRREVTALMSHYDCICVQCRVGTEAEGFRARATVARLRDHNRRRAGEGGGAQQGGLVLVALTDVGIRCSCREVIRTGTHASAYDLCRCCIACRTQDSTYRPSLSRSQQNSAIALQQCTRPDTAQGYNMPSRRVYSWAGNRRTCSADRVDAISGPGSSSPGRST